MSILYLNSKNARNSIHYLDEAVVGKYKLLSFCYTNNLFNVNDNNNKIYLNENGSNKIGTLTNGFYDLDQLMLNITTALNLVCSGTVATTLDSTTNKYTITNTLNYYFTFETNTDNSARKLLGMNASDGTNNTSQTSSVPVDVNTYKEIFMNIVENDCKNVCGVNYFNTSLVINGSGLFGEMMRYINVDNFDQYLKIKNTKSLEVKFHDVDENIINLNSDYSIILKKC